MKKLRQIVGASAAVAVVLFLTLAMVTCTFLLGFELPEVRSSTRSEEPVSPAPPNDLQVVLSANR